MVNLFSQVPELPSPGPCKPNSKVSKTPSVLRESTVVSSPALMPKVPKPSPARNTMQPLSQNQGALNQVAPQGPGPDQGNGTRRKLNLDVQAGGVVESLMNAAVSDPNDTGVKVSCDVTTLPWLCNEIGLSCILRFLIARLGIAFCCCLYAFEISILDCLWYAL